MSEQHPQVERALLSVSDKTGLLDLARRLRDLGIEILSTGGTARLLAEHAIAVTQVADYTGYPEIMEGRVKTLHPRIHGGLLGRRGTDDAVMAERGIAPIDLVIGNLYPFEATISRAEASLSEAIEHIDIGGPAMLRAAAKNYAAVGVVTESGDYSRVAAALEAEGGLSDALRFELAAKAFAHTARYDTAIAEYLNNATATADEPFPATFVPRFERRQTMRYGENPHQRAAFYAVPATAEACLATARQLQGKALSFNNIADADTALECVRGFAEPACVIVKHANPCGVAVAGGLAAAYQAAYAADPSSAFGGIIAFNRRLDAEALEVVLAQQFVEVIVAPGVDDAAMSIAARRANLRLLSCGHLDTAADHGVDMKRVRGGLLVQEVDAPLLPEGSPPQVVTRRAPEAKDMACLELAWRVAKYVKSNAIVYAGDGRSLGIGAGQMSRVDSARLGADKARAAGLSLVGSVLASDAFFPFRDGIDQAAAFGVRAVIQPGGSKRDAEVIAAADEHDIAMVHTGMRHFRH